MTVCLSLFFSRQCIIFETIIGRGFCDTINNQGHGPQPTLTSTLIIPDITETESNKLFIILIIIHQTHYEKSGWLRAFNQFTIACELDMINAISAADIAFIMSSSTSAWLPSPLECSPQKQNG